MLECQTADDVRAAARRRAEWRKKMFAPPPRPPVQVVSNPEPPTAPLPDKKPTRCLIQVASIPEEPRKLRPSIGMIKTVVADRFGISVLDIESERRTANLVRPRQIVMYLAKTMTLRSLPEIGRQIGWRDHTTVMHGARKIEDKKASDGELASLLDSLAAEIQACVEKARDDMVRTIRSYPERFVA